jgi:hypothetical protein
MAVKITNTNEGGQEEMYATAEELKQAYPALCAELQTAARTEGEAAGVRQERKRLEAIDGIAAGIGDAELLNNAKYGEAPLDAGALAVAALAKQTAKGQEFLTNIQADAQAGGAGEVSAAPNSGAELSDDEARAQMAQNIAKFAKGGK